MQKTIALLAVAAFAASPAAATWCPQGQIPVSVEGGQTGCAWPQVCVAETWGNCPPGSYCTRVKTGVLGCRLNGWQPYNSYTDTLMSYVGYNNQPTCPAGQIPVSVEGRETGCAAQPICAGVQGNCPTGSYCGIVRTGVLGCKPGAPPAQPGQCPPGQAPVSVEYGQNGCAPYPICVGETWGNCPAGSVCGRVQTGVLGCTLRPRNLRN